MDILNLGKSKIKQDLLRLFFSHPERRYYIRELARMLNLPPAYIRRELIKMENEGLFKSEFAGKERYFFLNPDYFLYQEVKSIVERTIGIEGSLKKALSRIEGIKEAYIFGSYAKNKLTPDSDIDLFIVGSNNYDKTLAKITSLQEKFGREFNLIDMSEAEFDKKKKHKDELLSNILSGKKIKLL
jgi:predicted nucleotidyltransferase